jgi:hypothetical protein
MPTDQCAPEREERLVRVGSLLVLHARAAKLVQLPKRPLDHPPPPPEATPVPRATPRYERANPTPAQPTPNRLRVVAAIPDYAGQARAIGHARPSTLRSARWTRQERFDKIPQRIREQRAGHNRPRYLAATGSMLLSASALE